MAATVAPKLIYGAASLTALATPDVESTLEILRENNAKSLDTATVIAGSEATLSKHNAPKTFEVHTKTPALSPGCLSRESILKGIETSLKDLQVDAIDLYYLHTPDPVTPLEDTLSAIQELYTAGKFRRFGILNYLPHDVQKIYDIQAAANSVLPTVYQGNYNAVARHSEHDLFPLLRKLHIDFYAYSPIAGGFLAKDPEKLRSKDVEGRFSGQTFLGDMYPKLCGKESMYRALEKWRAIANDAGVSRAALAYRWVVYHSALEKKDGVIVGASRREQLEETLQAIQDGPLEKGIAERAGGI